MSEWVIKISSTLPVSLVGRKASALGRLIAAGFPVPTSVCVSTQALREAQRKSLQELCLPDGLLETLVSALPMDQPLAVRSSAEMEDLPESSLAGRYATRLNVFGPAALAQAVLDCWRSAENGPADNRATIAVLVQPMLPAECAGVCFTVDPVRLRPDLLLVTSAWGLGLGVAEGSVPADTARLRRIDLGLEEASIAEKHTGLYPVGSGGGVAPVAIPEDLRAIPCLPDAWLQRIGQLGLSIEQLFGAPQDVEWTISDRKLWILQSRPITALPAEVREAVRFPIAWATKGEARRFWWLENYWEERGGRCGAPLLPAELDFVHINLQGGHDSVYFNGLAGTRLRKVVNGRVYMAAANSPHSPGHVRVYGAALRDLAERLEQQDVTLWEYWGPEIVRATGRLAAFDARGATGSALADHLEDAIATAARHWMVHTSDIPRPIRSAALLDSYTRLTGLAPEAAASEIPFLLAGAETIQTRLVETLYDLACLALESPEPAQTVVSGSQADGGGLADPALASSAFARGFQQLIAEYGDRLCFQPVPNYPVDLPLPWREAPEQVWNMIAAYLPLARQGGTSPRELRLAAQHSSDQRVEMLCAAALTAGAGPQKVKDFRRNLAYARRNAAYLDEHNHYIDQLSEGQYVQALLAAGRYLAGHAGLPAAYDVFWLHTAEILKALRDPAVYFEPVLAERKRQFAEWQSFLPPACLGLPGSILPERPARSLQSVRAPSAPLEMPGNRLTGEPASRGRAAGRARLVSDQTLPPDLAQGDVLIAPFASPHLIPSLLAVSAVVLDEGSPGDHFAISAREFGLPAVCATHTATRLIPAGAWVSVDAFTGLVTWT